MAKRKQPNGDGFQPGNPGRKVGTTIIPQDVRELNRRDASLKISLYLRMTKKELEEAINDPFLPSMDLLIIKVIAEAIKKGDFTRFNFLLDRTIGKVKDYVDISNEDGSLAPVITVTLPANNREKKSDS